MRISRLLACAVTVAIAVSPAVAAADTASPPTLFVNTDASGNQQCSDTGPGTYRDPLCTVQAAANIVVPGQTVVVDPTESTLAIIGGDLHITRSGTSGAPIVFETGNGVSPTGMPTSVELRGGTNGFVLDGVHDVTIRGFGVDDTTSTGVVISNSSDITLDHDNVQVSTPAGTADGVDVSGTSSDVTISRSVVDTNANNISISRGVTGTDVAENIFPGLYSTGGFGDGVLVDGAANTDVTNNTEKFELNYCANKPVFAVTGGATGTSLENNIIRSQCGTNSPLVLVDPNSTASTKWDYNAVYDNSDDAIYFWGGVVLRQATSFASGTGQATHD